MNQGTFSPLSLVALESIDFQVKDKTVKELEIIFDDIKNDFSEGKKITVESIKPYVELIQSKLRKRFNLSKLEFIVTDEEEVNGFYITPDITSSSQMFKTYRDLGNKAVDGRLALDNYGSVDGSVDLKTGRVEGLLSTFPVTVGLSIPTLTCLELKPIHVVALLMHEVGHYITYLETLNFTFSTCFILADTMSKINKAKKPEERIKIFKEIEKKTGIDIGNQDILSESEDSSTTAINIFTDITESKNSEFGSTIYDMRSWESLADQFSARMGLTVPLAEASEIITRLINPSNKSFKSNFTILMTSIIRWIAIIGVTVICPALGGFFIIIELLMLLISPFNRVYDKPGERIKRLRNELMAEAKNPNLSIENRKRIADDVEVIDAIAKRIDDKEDYVEKVWLFFSSDARDQKKRRLLLQDLQALTNNDLFASANVLKLLKEVK